MHILLSVCVNLTTLHTSCKWNPTIFLFCDWLLSLSIIFSIFIPKPCHSVYFIPFYCQITLNCIDVVHFIYPSVCFPFLAITVMLLWIWTSFPVDMCFHFSLVYARGGIAGSWSNSVFNLLRNGQASQELQLYHFKFSVGVYEVPVSPFLINACYCLYFLLVPW